ncbi:DUF2182 domain-containing protein [Profundibacterium mesophilum]|uniref:Membrane protein n=1 Tax=Profundibacterium mesophilum KAUST100406-0324 TaxID=1037889 RepID=A0A921TGL3_9RHOB|nr:DUF2182 domain-containing protein [Profundibacterium mesophilum]KAF0677549.1 putative membrane protein [Profundibacterium mesophilum KAUST100406-0324]
MSYFAPRHTLRNVLWIGFFAAILAAWAVMYAMSRQAGVDLLGRPAEGMGAMMGPAPFDVLLGMWAVMMAAMMLPTMVPTLRAYEDLIYAMNATWGGWIGVLAGYMLAWIGFAVLITGGQFALLGAGLIDGMGRATSLWVTGALLSLVGLFQFSRTKAICHGVCHAPMTHFLGHWRPGIWGGIRMGGTLGLYCCGCCWGYMVLGFTGGVMNLLWMGLATFFMVLEKLPQVGHYLMRPIGSALLAGGMTSMVLATGLLS